MKALHRTKALAAYEGARMAMQNDMSYPAYMLLKEAARGVLSYMSEDSMEIDISEKTKLSRLLEFTRGEISTEDTEAIQNLIDAESQGLERILSIPMEDLREVKKVIKMLIGEYLKEPV